MAMLTIRGVPASLHARLKDRADRNRRSLNAETLVLLERALQVEPAYDEGPLGGPVYSPSAGDLGRVVRERVDVAALPTAGAIKELLIERRQDLRALGVRRVGLFGSVLKGNSRPDSDLDVIVEFDPAEKTYDRFSALASYLERLTGRRVDLVTTEGLSPFIGPRILEEAVFVAVGE
jgi:predicted nucleotidyltransferase